MSVYTWRVTAFTEPISQLQPQVFDTTVVYSFQVCRCNNIILRYTDGERYTSSLQPDSPHVYPKQVDIKPQPSVEEDARSSPRLASRWEERGIHPGWRENTWGPPPHPRNSNAAPPKAFKPDSSQLARAALGHVPVIGRSLRSLITGSLRSAFGYVTSGLTRRLVPSASSLTPFAPRGFDRFGSPALPNAAGAAAPSQRRTDVSTELLLLIDLIITWCVYACWADIRRAHHQFQIQRRRAQ